MSSDSGRVVPGVRYERQALTAEPVDWPADDVKAPMVSAVAGWMEEAACADEPASDLPWLDDIQHVDDADSAVMLAVCVSCPALSACAAFVEQTHVTGGFWAGKHRDLIPTKIPTEYRYAS